MSELDGSAFRDASRRLRDVGDLVDATAGDVVDDFAAAALDNVRRRRARHRVTGKGERMIGIRTVGSGATRVARVHASGKVAAIIAGGSRAHAIRPVAARALQMPGTSRGFAAAVRHPGTQPDPFVAKGIADTRPELESITDAAADELAVAVTRKIGRR